MASSNSTANLHLNQWVGADKPKMADFNADNLRIDEAVSAHIAGTGHVSEAERAAWGRAIPVLGSYTGDGQPSQEITLGFQPSFGIVFAPNMNLLQPGGGTNVTVFSGFVSAQGCSQALLLTATGFKGLYSTTTVSGRLAMLNLKDQLYVYFMFK